MKEANDSLWDPAQPDAEIEALERALAPHRFDPRAHPLSDERLGTRARPRRTLFALAATVLVALGFVAWRAARSSDAPAIESPYRLHALAGEPRIEGGGAGASALRPGEALVLDADSRAELRVAGVGTVEIEPGSRLRIGEPADGAAGARYLLHLEEGAVSASIFAAPRLFQLGTPAGIAVDLGCEYTARVDGHGATRLSVTLGLVSFETQGREVIVPSGASTVAEPGARPGTPLWDDAPDAVREALARLDAGGAFDERDLERVLATEDERDSLTLWHLLDDPREAVRAQSFDRLRALVPPPDGVTREGVLAGDAEMRRAWRRRTSWSW